jgi:hypothetical protein
MIIFYLEKEIVKDPVIIIMTVHSLKKAYHINKNNINLKKLIN